MITIYNKRAFGDFHEIKNILTVQVLFLVIQCFAPKFCQENLRDGIWKCQTRRIIADHDIYVPGGEQADGGDLFIGNTVQSIYMIMRKRMQRGRKA